MIRLAAAILALWPLAAGAQTITSAKYINPTDRYDHGVLGSIKPWATLQVTFEDGRRRRFNLPEERVFEDIAPRVIDLDGDGKPEIVTVESHIYFGSRLSVWDAEGLVTANEWIGEAHRWLAPVGAVDIDGDGFTEIAYIDRPHLARELAIYRYRDRALEFVISILPFTNHRIGDETITGGVRTCGRQPEFIVASGDWDKVIAVAWGADGPRVRSLGANRGPQSFERALACKR